MLSPYWCKFAVTLWKSQGKFVYIAQPKSLNYLVTLTICNTAPQPRQRGRLPHPIATQIRHPNPHPRLSAYDLWRTDTLAAAH
jgi:hypothetical protein